LTVFGNPAPRDLGGNNFEIIRKHAYQSSASIIKAISESLQDYRKKASQEDDITLVVIKLL